MPLQRKGHEYGKTGAAILAGAGLLRQLRLRPGPGFIQCRGLYNFSFSFLICDSCRKSAVMLDRISLGRFLCLSGLLWLLYGLNGAWYGVRLGLSVHSSCTVTTLSNLEMPYTVMVPTIALYHSGVRAVVSPVSFNISPSYVCFLFFFYLILV